MRLYKKQKPEKKELTERIELLEKENKELLKKTNKSDHFEAIAQSVIQAENIGILYLSGDETNIHLRGPAGKVLGLLEDTEEISLDSFLNVVSADDKNEVKNFFTGQGPAKNQSILFKIIKTDQEREVRYVSSRIISSSSSEKNIFSVSDVTRHEKIKKELTRAKEKAEESNRVKNIFLTNISHEIRVPMNSIVGFAELINIGNVSPDERREYINIIKHQSNHLLKFIDDISEIAKFEAGEVKIKKTACNLNLLLNELYVFFNQHKKQLKKEQVDLKFTLPDKKGVVVSTDSGRLHQLLTNLISNAIKFTEKGFVEFGYLPKEGKIEFFVKDTGIGLTKEEQKHIFDRLKINEETLTRKYEGSGLGLTIARGIVKLLGGKIWIDSEPGNGSVFYFTIPFEKAPEKVPLQADEESESRKFNWKGKIMLVVEDDEVNFKFLETLLSENQAKVLRAVNGVQAIELCKTISKIDIILMDIMMPQMDGFEATRQIRKINSMVPVIAQTALTSEEEKNKYLSAGCNDQVSKPINIEELLSKINNLLIS